MIKPEPIKFVVTPKDWDEISTFIIRHPPDVRSTLLTAAAMGWNLAVKLNQEKDR